MWSFYFIKILKKISTLHWGQNSIKLWYKRGFAVNLTFFKGQILEPNKQNDELNLYINFEHQIKNWLNAKNQVLTHGTVLRTDHNGR
jgi:hypothetical protein